MATITRCISCDGYGWVEDDFSGESENCTWCDGIGYVYRDDQGVDHVIDKKDWERPEVMRTLEALEEQRLREMGYSGSAKKPWEQEIRKGTKGGLSPYDA